MGGMGGVEVASRAVEVRVYRYGLLKVCQWCDSEADAAMLVAMWSAHRGTRCEIARATL